MDCPFCEMPKARIVFETSSFYVVEDAYPVTSYHSLIITHDHHLTFSIMSEFQQIEFASCINKIKAKISSMDPSVTGFNIGINEGQDAGQTVMHFHCHVIPRRNGDMLDPRGGVRGVIPNKQKY